MKKQYIRLSGGGVASKILGALREIVLARSFGTGVVADAYRGSLSLTLSPVHLLTTRVVQTSFLPLYARYAREDMEKARVLFFSLLAGFLAFGVILGIALYGGAGALIAVVLRGFDPERTSVAAAMLRVMALGVPFYIYCSVLGALGGARNDFTIPSLRPGLQNLGMLVAILLAARFGRPVIAAAGFTAAYIVLAAIATFHLSRKRLFPSRRRLNGALLGEVWLSLYRVARPLLVLSVLIEGNILIERYVASLLGPGRVATVDYARFITETIHFLFTVPLGLLGLSLFAKLDEKEVRSKAGFLLGILSAALIPASAFLLVNGRAVAALLYMRKAFDLDSLALTERALLGFSASLWLFSAGFLLQRILNARMANATVLRGEALSIAANVTFNLLFYRRLGVLIIGLGLGAGSLLSFTYYLWKLKPERLLAMKAILIPLAAAPLYVVGARAARRFSGVDPPSLLWQIPLALLFWGIVLLSLGDLRRAVAASLSRKG